jgi:uncharacterized protein (TIGR02001 family)
MNMKLLLACAGAVVTATASFAQTPTPPAAVAPAPAAPSFTVTATASAVSQYMFRGLRLSDGGFQPSVEMSSGSLTLGAWGNFPLDGDKVPGSSDPEIDLYGSYSIPVAEQITLAPGFTSYNFPNAPESAGFYRSTFEPNIALSWTMASGVKLTPKVYYDLVLKGPTYEITALYALPLPQIGSELDFTATYGGYKWTEAANDTSPDVKAWGQYWLLGVAAPFQITPKSKLTLAFAYTEGRDAFTKAGDLGKTPNSLAIGRGVVTFSYAYTF